MGPLGFRKVTPLERLAVLAARQIDAGVNGNMTLPLGAASDHTEVNKTTSPPAVERCHPSGGGMVYGGVVWERKRRR